MDWLDELREHAKQEGFVAMGVTPAIESQGFSRLVQWIEAGFAGSMHYFANRLDAYRHPKGVLPGAKSIIVLMMPYHPQDFPATAEQAGQIARYAWQGSDYHDVIHPKLKRLCRYIKDNQPAASARGIVDTAPLMEREVAQLAGLGWRGKNTLLLNQQWGSYFFLACILLDIELPPDQPTTTDHCGTCTACLDACPTDAFPSPGVLDATRCISYLTIESPDLPPRHLSGVSHRWLFGCDICQEVCPWNRKPARRANQLPAQGDIELQSLDLAELFRLDDEAFRWLFRKTPLWRGRRRGLLRNAAILLGNSADPTARNALEHGLTDQEPLVRAACVRSLKQHWADSEALQQREKTETDSLVMAELFSTEDDCAG